MEYNKLTNDNNNKELKMSIGKDSSKSRINNRNGTVTMEPNDNLAADFDISADKKRPLTMEGNSGSL
jgi:hypothetical protein